MFDLNEIIDKNDIYKSISNYKLDKKYYDSTILENRNIDNITGSIQKGLIIKRSNLKAFPTFNIFEDGIDDLNQESELHVGLPVLILHTSLDNKWFYIRLFNYEGWTLQENINIVNDKTFDTFFNCPLYIIITEPLIEIDNFYLDMSVKLPLINENIDSYDVLFPNKKIYQLKKNICCKGYLKQDFKTLINQAKKYLNTKYGWGGIDNKVDCSSFVGNVFRTFNIFMPRNTREQKDYIGIKTDTSNLSENEIKAILNNTVNPTLLYTKKHVMFYFKKEKNEHFVIHASGFSRKVQIDTLSSVNNKNLYSEIISINEIILFI